jgi:type VI protein secretion system component VasK
MVRYLVLGFLFTVWGVLMTWKPYRLAKFEEQIDAIGSKRRSTKVEPADWKVTLTRRLGPVLSFLGLLLMGLAYAS